MKQNNDIRLAGIQEKNSDLIFIHVIYCDALYNLELNTGKKVLESLILC
jgi:hypothetical protein